MCSSDQFTGGRPPLRTADNVPDPIAERLTGVGPERVLVRRRESLELGDGADQRFLDDVFGVEVFARPDRQPASRPTFKRGRYRAHSSFFARWSPSCARMTRTSEESAAGT